MKRNTRRTVSRRCVVAALFICALPVSAADADDAASAPVLEEVIVTAQKREQSLIDVPISLAVVGRDIMDKAQITDSQDFVQVAPSLTFTRSFAASASSFSMRGVSSFVQQGSIQPAVPVIVDGVPLSRSAEFIMNLSDVERIEVMRGPQGTLIGKNATAGALNIATQRPEEHFRAVLEGSRTDDEETILRAMATGPLVGDALRYRVNYFRRDMDGFIPNIHPVGDDHGGVESEGVLGKLDFDVSDNMLLRLSADYRDIRSEPHFLVLVPDTELSQEFVERNGFRPSFDDPMVNIDIEPLNFDRGWGASIDFQWALGDSLKFRSITAYREHESDSDLDIDLGPDTLKPTTFEGAPGVFIGFKGFALGRGRAPIDTDTFTQEIQFEGSGARYQFVAGAFYQAYSERSFLTLPAIVDLAHRPPAPGPNVLISLVPFETEGDITDDTAAVFGDLTFDITDKLSAFAGARLTRERLDWRIVQMNLYDPDTETPAGTAQPFFEGATAAEVHAALERIRANPKRFDLATFQTLPPIVIDDSLSEDKLTGRIGLAYRFSDAIASYASYNTGFKGAGVNASGSATTPETSLVDSEDARSVELGLKGRFWNGRLSLNANAYAMLVENFQAAQLLPDGISTEVINAGDIDSRGIEVEFALAATQNLGLNGGLAYTDATIEDFVNTCYRGQTPAQGCTIDRDGDGEPDTQDMSGKRAPITPEWKWHLAADYRHAFSRIPWEMAFRLAYSWQGEQQFNLQDDPLAVNPEYGLLDATITLSDRDERYAFSLFGKNLTDERFYAGYGEVDGFIARSQAMPTRSAFRYWGIKARWTFY